MKTKTRTEQILMVMRILAWVAFVGLMVNCGGMIFSYVISLFNPEAAKGIYPNQDLYNLRQFNFWHYTLTLSFLVAIAFMEAYVSYMIIKTLSKIKLANPFTMEVALKLETISHILFGIWLMAMLHNAHTAWVAKRMGELQVNFISGEFIFIAGVVYVVSQIFKRGVEIQSENELTV